MGEWFQISRARFEINSTITPELYDTKFSYQLIVSITKCENLFEPKVEKKKAFKI